MRPEKKQALTVFHRDQILKAAEALFLEKGVGGATMEEIAKKADYSKATLYVYFKSKEEMVSALALRGMRRLRETIAAALERSGGWIPAYYAVCQAVADFYLDSPMAYEAAASALQVDLDAPDTPEVFREIFVVGEQLNRLVADFLEQGARQGLVRPQENPVCTVFVLWASLTGIVRMVREKQEYMSRCLGESRETMLRRSFRFLLCSLLEPGKGEGA